MACSGFFFKEIMLLATKTGIITCNTFVPRCFSPVVLGTRQTRHPEKSNKGPGPPAMVLGGKS